MSESIQGHTLALPLAGIRVLDLSRVLAGPSSAMLRRLVGLERTASSEAVVWSTRAVQDSETVDKARARRMNAIRDDEIGLRRVRA